MKKVIVVSPSVIRACDDARLAAIIRESARGTITRKLALAEMTRRLNERI